MTAAGRARRRPSEGGIGRQVGGRSRIPGTKTSCSPINPLSFVRFTTDENSNTELGESTSKVMDMNI